MTMSLNLLFPEEIIFKILTLLPVLELLRCKSVCKLWLSIIKHPQFIQTHLNISNNQPPSLLNMCLVVRNEEYTIPTTFLMCRGGHSSRIGHPKQFDFTTRFVGYCNGLVCLTDYLCDVFCIWNPSIKSFKMLPAPNNKMTYRSPVKLGFGYDCVGDDYKVVRIFVSRTRNVVKGELFSVSEDCWKEIDLPVAVHNAWPFVNYTRVDAINGVLYFVGLDVLVSLDLHNEVFQVYPYPESVKDIRYLTSFVFEGSIAMIFKTAVGDGFVQSSLWKLDNVCWTKSFDLEPKMEIDQVALYLGGGRFVGLDLRDSRFFVYDLMKKETERLFYPSYNSKVLATVKYTESLVSLAGFEQVEYSGSLVLWLHDESE